MHARPSMPPHPPRAPRPPATGAARRPAARSARARAAALVLPLLALLALGHAFAQRPLVSPIYYLSTLPALEPGVAVRGELTPEDGQNFKDGSRVDLYRLAGSAGQALRLEAHSDGIDPYLSLYAADGTLLASADDDPDTGSTDAVLSTTLPAGGRYLIVVSGYAAEDLGAYTLLARLGAPTGAGVEETDLPLPAAIDTELDPDGPAAPDLFDGPSRRFAVTLDRPALLLATLRSPDFDAGLLLYDDAGALVAFGDDNVELQGTDARLAAELPAGRYHLVAAAFDTGSGGAFRLEVRRFQPID